MPRFPTRPLLAIFVVSASLVLFGWTAAAQDTTTPKTSPDLTKQVQKSQQTTSKAVASTPTSNKQPAANEKPAASASASAPADKKKHTATKVPKEQPPSAAPLIRYGEVVGDFRPFFDKGKLIHGDDGKPVTLQVSVLNQDLQVIGEAQPPINPSPDKMEIFYTLTDPKAVPAFVLVGTKSPGDHLYPFTSTKAPGSDPSIVSFHQVVAGDFCLPDQPGPDHKCTTDLLTLIWDDTKDPHVMTGFTPVSHIKASVQAADGTYKDATLDAIDLTSAVSASPRPLDSSRLGLCLKAPAAATLLHTHPHPQSKSPIWFIRATI